MGFSKTPIGAAKLAGYIFINQQHTPQKKKVQRTGRLDKAKQICYFSCGLRCNGPSTNNKKGKHFFWPKIANKKDNNCAENARKSEARDKSEQKKCSTSSAGQAKPSLVSDGYKQLQLVWRVKM